MLKCTTNLREILLATKRRKAIDRYVEAAEARRAATSSEPVPSFFPLEYFDDLTFEICEIDQVRSALRAGERVPARSLWHIGDGTSEWRPCEVLEAKEAEDAYLIRWAGNGQAKWASRLNVCFDGLEDVPAVEARRSQALDHRARCEAILRYERRLDARPSAGAQQLSPQQFHAVAQRVGGGPQLQRRLAAHPSLAEEVLGHYARSMVKIGLDHTRADVDPAETADGVAVRGERGLPVRLLKVPGHGAFSLVPLHAAGADADENAEAPIEPGQEGAGGEAAAAAAADGGEGGEGGERPGKEGGGQTTKARSPAAGAAARRGGRRVLAGVGSVQESLSWAAPSMMRALSTMRKCTLAAHERR